MLVTGLIHSRLSEAVKTLNKSSISTYDMLIKSGHMRMVLHDDQLTDCLVGMVIISRIAEELKKTLLMT